jgi:hypothetical protein
MLTAYDWVYGSGQIASVILSVAAAWIALGMFKEARQRKSLRAWKYLLSALIFFTIEELVGALKTFGVWSTPWLTHVIPSIILGFLITAIIIQIQITKGCD